ncbi:MAG: hypothetical protein MJZ34_06840 [Paludibacteraceae bacterium]|nr:hypothetical protein [Paludibacteraceae bacterium]
MNKIEKVIMVAIAIAIVAFIPYSTISYFDQMATNERLLEKYNTNNNIVRQERKSIYESWNDSNELTGGYIYEYSKLKAVYDSSLALHNNKHIAKLNTISFADSLIRDFFYSYCIKESCKRIYPNHIDYAIYRDDDYEPSLDSKDVFFNPYTFSGIPYRILNKNYEYHTIITLSYVAIYLLLFCISAYAIHKKHRIRYFIYSIFCALFVMFLFDILMTQGTILNKETIYLIFIVYIPKLVASEESST